MSEGCACPPCTMCRGRGYHDDTRAQWDGGMGEETCDECGGSGIEFECDYCHDQRELDEAAKDREQ